jgi:hypothetical protein
MSGIDTNVKTFTDVLLKSELDHAGGAPMIPQNADANMDTNQYQPSVQPSASVPALTNQNDDNDDDDDDTIIAERIYDDLIRSICLDVAAGVHKMAKSGTIPLSHAAESRIRNHPHNRGSGKRKREIISEQSANAAPSSAKCKDEGGGGGKKENEMRLRTRGSTFGVDAWGRVPPKDTLTVCKLCSKNMSATRFAAHLDKCLGIGNSRGGHSSRSSKS